MAASNAQHSGATASYDIIIIGAGTAGCVVANRLSEDPNISILLLEAGEYRNTDEKVYTPGLGGDLLDNPSFDWQFESVPNDGLKGRTIKHPRGKVVGGSSAINSFALITPSAAGMDAWAELGNDGWDWRGVGRYFQKYQTVCQPTPDVREELSIDYIGETSKHSNGPIQATFPTNMLPQQKAWADTWQRLGLANTTDPLDGHALGGCISTCHVTSSTRERSHAGTAYYEPVRDRSNLHLLQSAMVERIVFEKKSGGDAEATGVSFLQNGKHCYAIARKEVVLSAGAFGSPQILELSGIGSAERLKNLSIDLLYDNPNVGGNLQDHLTAGISFETASGVQFRNTLSPEESRKLYETSRSGPWADMVCHTFAYLPLNAFISQEEQARLNRLADQERTSAQSRFEQGRNSFISKVLASPAEATTTAFLTSKRVIPGQDSSDYITLNAMLSHPYSRGSVHVTSPDPSVKPRIDFAYLSNPLDVEIQAHHLQALIQIAKTEPLSNYIKQDGKHLPIDASASTIEGAKDLYRRYGRTNYHPCSSCSMMPEEIGGVVDARLKVYGTTNLRIVDASIFPIIPRGNIISTVYAVAEKASDLISEDLGLKRTS